MQLGFGSMPDLPSPPHHLRRQTIQQGWAQVFDWPLQSRIARQPHLLRPGRQTEHQPGEGRVANFPGEVCVGRVSGTTAGSSSRSRQPTSRSEFQNVRQDLQAKHVPVARLPKDAPETSQLVLEQ